MIDGPAPSTLALDHELGVVAVDVAMAEALGRRVDELVGCRLHGLVHPDDARLVSAILRGRPTAAACTRWRWQVGGEWQPLLVWWRARGDGWAGALGRPDDLGVAPAVVSAPSTVEQAERMARLGVFEHELQAGKTAWSPVMFELHDLDPAGPAPATLEEYLRLVHPDDAEPWLRALGHTLDTGELVTLTNRVRRREGGYRWLEVTLRCVLRADGSPAAVAGTMQDVSEDVAARAELVRDRERAVAETRAKGEFLARVTHELRAPVAGVIGMIDLAIEDSDPVERAAHLGSARASAHHLLELIDDLLDASREDAWRFGVVAIDFTLDEVLAQALAMVAPRAQRKGLTLTSEVAPSLGRRRRGDPLRLRQILVNLLHNAVKFTERGGVGVRVDGGEAGEVRLTVEDTGIGIAPEVQGRVFEPYVSGDAGEGTGLGLAITRELVHALGGRIDFSSAPGAGTCFTVVLPLPEHNGDASGAPARAAGAGEPRARAVRPLRALVVEDHPVNAAYLRTVLERAGHQVLVVGTGQAGIDASAAGRDVALMDLELPDLDGTAAVRAIRAAELREQRPRLPVLGVSAHRDRALIAAAAGMDGYLTKPVEVPLLLAQLDRLTADGGRPPVDHVQRLARVGGRRELAATIVQTYLGHAAGLLAPVDGALDAGSEEGVHRAAHGLRAALLMVGALPAAELAAELERASLERARALRPRLAFELARATAELELVAASG